MTLKERYNFIVENISKKPYGTFDIYELVDIPDFFNENEKIKINNKNYTFNLELTDKATPKDYEDYIKYVLQYTGMDAMFNTNILFDPDEEGDYDI